MDLNQILQHKKHQTRIEKIKIESAILQNLNSKFPLRKYQKIAIKRFDYYLNTDFQEKQIKPYHLNFNMATGSGKTLLMAAFMLYLYKKGYRNFLFFVNSSTILSKTKENFTNKASAKYLFANELFMVNKKLEIKAINSFEESEENAINIVFTSIQKLHNDLNNPAENGISPTDFQKHKIIFIADEAHHINVSTKKEIKQEEENWENTVLKIVEQNKENLLLEFTATLDIQNKGILKKYKDKILFQYDLKAFRQEGFSKEIQLVQSNKTIENRVLQALVINQYKQDLALENGIELKPVILFKEQLSIKASEENKLWFHKLIENINVSQLEKLKQESELSTLNQAFSFYSELSFLIKRLQYNFTEKNCLSANNEYEKEQNQLLLNSLESKNNHIRAIFAVQKLNEGWDVLNLFDIVRMNEKSTRVKTTISEAQLIGRGARYFPFVTPKFSNKYTRKFDTNNMHPLRILEELHYYTISDNVFIKQLKNNLLSIGILADSTERKIKKEEFKPVIKSAIRTHWNHKKLNIRLPIESEFSALEVNQDTKLESINYSFEQIPMHIVQAAISANPFFRFNRLKSIFPELKSSTEFIQSKNYLGDISMTLHIRKPIHFSNRQLYTITTIALTQIENELSQ